MSVHLLRRLARGLASDHDGSVPALIANFIAYAHTRAYQDVLYRDIFTGCEDDLKLRLSNCRILADLDTKPVLEAIWKESPSVSSADLERIGMSRAFPNFTMTANGLGRELCDKRGTMSASVKRVEKIVRAGRAFGLIEKRPIDGKRVAVLGTARLHGFIVAVEVESMRLLEPLLRNFAPPREDMH